MSAMASKITSLTIVYSTVYSSADQRKRQSSASLAFVWRIAQRARNAENVSIWWRHHVTQCGLVTLHGVRGTYIPLRWGNVYTLLWPKRLFNQFEMSNSRTLLLTWKYQWQLQKISNIFNSAMLWRTEKQHMQISIWKLSYLGYLGAGI